MRTFFILLTLVPCTAYAEIYRCTDSAGHVTYSNVESAQCKKMAPVASREPPQRWKSIGAPENGLYYDSKSLVISATERTVKAWLLRNAEGNGSSKHLVYFRCDKRTYALPQFVAYQLANGEGQILSSNTEPTPVFKDLNPETVLEAAFVEMCKKIRSR